METILAIVTGVGLSAACGFRIFVPLLLMNLAALYGYLNFAPGFEWLGSHYATVAFTSATVFEIIAYYVPWLDNVMDAIASPVSVLAGTMVTASVITDLSPSVKWTLAIMAGGGIAGLLQGATTALRGKSSLFTGGIGNHAIATLELAGSVIITFLSMALPVISIVLVLALAVYLLIRAGRTFLRKMRPGNWR
jgi:hypothetical protein